MTIACNICNKSFTNQESLNQHNQSKHYRSEKKNINLKKYSLENELQLSKDLTRREEIDLELPQEPQPL